MKQLILILIISIQGIYSYSQNDCNIIDEYSNIFRVEKRVSGERVGILRFVNTLDKSKCYSELINNNKM